MKQIDLCFNDRTKISTMLLCFVVIVESLEVEHIFIELIFCILNSLLFFIDLRVSRLLQFFVFVALVIATCLLTMLLPVSEAKPAKLMRAELASHMIATLVLFNWFFTLRALFRVGHDPGNVLAFIRIFSLPLNSCFATARTV